MGKFGVIFVATLACVAGTFVFAAEPEQLPTSEEVHKLYDDGQYQPAIQKLQRLLQLKGAAAQPYDRVDLLMLRGEALLQLKQQSAATEAFNSAAKEAVATQQPDTKSGSRGRKPEQVALARATAMLVRNSRNFAYTPKVVPAGEKPAPISLLDASLRDSAFKALLADSETELKPKAKAAAHVATLPPIIETVRMLGDLRALETIVTKKTVESDAMLADVAEQANKLMGNEADRLAPRVDAINISAHQKVRHENRDTQKTGTKYTTTITVTYTLRGLQASDSRELQQAMGTCEQIVYMSRDFEEIASAALVPQFKAVEAKALKTGTKASETLNDDYSGVTTDPVSTIRR